MRQLVVWPRSDAKFWLPLSWLSGCSKRAVGCKRPATREDTNAASCYHLIPAYGRLTLLVAVGQRLRAFADGHHAEPATASMFAAAVAPAPAHLGAHTLALRLTGTVHAATRCWLKLAHPAGPALLRELIGVLAAAIRGDVPAPHACVPAWRVHAVLPLALLCPVCCGPPRTRREKRVRDVDPQMRAADCLCVLYCPMAPPGHSISSRIARRAGLGAARPRPDAAIKARGDAAGVRRDATAPHGAVATAGSHDPRPGWNGVLRDVHLEPDRP